MNAGAPRLDVVTSTRWERINWGEGGAMKKHIHTTNSQTFNSAFIAQSIKAHLEAPEDPRAKAICEKILEWISLTVAQRKIGRNSGDILCETVAQRAVKRLLSNDHLNRNAALRHPDTASHAPTILRILFKVCEGAVADQIYEVHRRKLDKRHGEEITITGCLSDGAVPAELAVHPSCVSREFEVEEALGHVAANCRPIVKAALCAKTQRQIAKEHGISLAEVHKRLRFAIQNASSELQP